MSIPTVYLTGTDRLPLIPEYLNLGTIVVVSPDQATLDSWEREHRKAQRLAEEDEEDRPSGAVVDLDGRRIWSGSGTLPLSDREFRVMRGLLDPPGRAMSFSELRREGWGEGSDMPFDIQSVRALIQRLRAKLQVAHASISIVSIHGYGFRVEPLDEIKPMIRREGNASPGRQTA